MSPLNTPKSLWCCARRTAPWLVVLALMLASRAHARLEAADREESHGPWGISSSASSFRNHAEWLPKMSACGVTQVRLFPEWPSIETKKDVWNWKDADALVKAAADNKIAINGILMGTPPGSKGGHTFPMHDLEGWSRYVEKVVGHYPSIRYWEVWNEGNGGFNDGHHTTADYAKLATVAYEAAKKANAKSQIGLTVASFDAPYLDHAMRTMAKEGKPDSFDFLCIHPYEVADGLADPDGEIPFLWMSRTLRDALKSSAPKRANAEIWMTEVARRMETQHGRVVTEHEAAVALVKIYTLALAQGIACTQWFEAQDPVGEDQGFGLLQREGSPRESFTALRNLTKSLGRPPKYEGWLALGRDGKGYGFLFRGEKGSVLVAWMPASQTDNSLTFGTDVGLIDPVIDSVVALHVKKSSPVTLTEAPLLIFGVEPELLQLARSHLDQNFPWGGDWSSAKSVSVQLGSPDGNKGVYQTQPKATPTLKFADGSTGIVVRGDQGVGFYCHPSFAGFRTKDYYVRATVRRITGGNLGMNLHYEVAESNGKSPYKNVGQWFGVSESSDWQTHTWHCDGACFSKMWGYDFNIRAEQSVPFVIGKVEVSTEPFK